MYEGVLRCFSVQAVSLCYCLAKGNQCKSCLENIVEIEHTPSLGIPYLGV